MAVRKKMIVILKIKDLADSILKTKDLAERS